jgi:hypothetical protein
LAQALPSDRAAAVDEVERLLPVSGMSTVTAVRTLQAAGVAIDDAEAEVERIRGESFAKAVQLVDALGDTQAAYDFLGLKRPAPDPAPAPAPAPNPVPVPPAPVPAPEPPGGNP